MSASRVLRATWFVAVAGFVLGAWLLLPREGAATSSRPRLTILLVDASASVARARAWLPWARSTLAAAAREAEARGEDLAVLSFADGVATGFPPGDPARFLALLEGREGAPFDPALGLARGATRLAEALVSVEGWSSDRTRPAPRLLLLGPGTFTGASPAPTWARLAASGVEASVRPPPEPVEPDVALLELRLPPEVEAGAPLIAVVRAEVRRRVAGASIALELEVECGGEVRSVSRSIPAPSTAGAFEFPIDLGPAEAGRTEVRAHARLPGDAWPENDRARARTLAEGARVIGVLVSEELRAAAEAWLAPGGRSALAGLQFLFLAPEELAREVDALSALVTFDLPLRALPSGVVSRFVRAGGGWLALSGFGFMTDWVPGEAEGELARLLPCEPARSESSPRDVVLLVDGSGSMEGTPFETVRAAALELVASALPSDRVSLRFFTGRLESEHVLKERRATSGADHEAARRAARDLLALRVPAGTTYLLSALDELARAAGEHETLTLLLSDGWEREGLPDPLARAREVTQRLSSARVRLVVIAVGAANLELLATLAQGLEGVRKGDTLQDLRDVFHRELHGSRLVEGDLPLVLAERRPGSLADEIASHASTATLPPLERFVRNGLRPGAEALWRASSGEPVLALTRVGLGRTSLFASRPGAPWAARYSRPGLGEPAEFEGLLRWLARGPARTRAPRALAAGTRITLSGLDPAAPALLTGWVESDGPREPLQFAPPADLGADPFTQRQARLPRELEPGEVLVLAAEPSEESLPIEVGLPDEFAWREGKLTPLEPPGAIRSEPMAGDGRSLAGPVLGGAIGLLLLAAIGLARGQGLRGRDR